MKEIHEQIDSSLRAISMGGRLLSNNKVKLGGIEDYKNTLVNIDNIILLGCGTSYHAGTSIASRSAPVRTLSGFCSPICFPMAAAVPL